MNKITLGSLFDGSGGFPLGALLSDIVPIWASEIEPFPIRVTTKRLPFLKHYGDVCKIDGTKVEPVDIITFGSPCQDMSVAGNRAGLDGSRSILFYEAIRIIKEMRCSTNKKYPRYAVWENVPGAFSSNRGNDFRSVLQALAEISMPGVSIPKCEKWKHAGSIVGDDFSIAWRLLDAQYFGVPQRRKRIYLVADFTGRSAEKILFKSESLSRYSSQSETPWKNSSRSAEDCFRASGCDEYNGIVETSYGINRSAMSAGYDSDMSFQVEKEKSSTLISAGPNAVAQQVFENHGQDSRYNGPLEKSPTVATKFGTGGNNQPFVVQTPKCFGVCSKDSNSMKSSNPYSGFYEASTTRTIDAKGGNPSCNQGGIAVIEGNGSRPSHYGDGYSESGVMYTLNSTEKHAVAYGIDRAAFNQGQNAQFSFSVTEESEATIVAKGPNAVAEPYSFYPQMKTESITFTENKSVTLVNGTNPGFQNAVIEPSYIVRRLTPTECARLQGFPDCWCSDLETEKPTNKEFSYWQKVFKEYARLMGCKEKTEKQIIKWLQKPHSDTAEYKMWGNGVALPCVYYVLSSIVKNVNSGQL